MTGPFLITGCGRSGTKWAAELFTTLGFPCGHEEAFSYDRSGPLTAGEASWLAVPHLDALDPSTPLVRVVRNPFAVVKSAVAKGFLADMADPFSAYVALHRPDIAAGQDHLGRVIRWAALWDEPMDGRAYWPLRVGGSLLSTVGAVYYVASLGGALGDFDAPLVSTVKEAVADLGTSINAPTEPRERPTLEVILAHPDAALLVRRAERVGLG